MSITLFEMAGSGGFLTYNQKQLLIEFVSSDEELMSAKFSSTFTFGESRRRWMAIANKLNTLAGANKDFKHWRKTWQDLRSKAKLKNAALRLHAAGTGGGPPAPTAGLSATDEMILQVINPVLITGHTGAAASEVNFDFSSVGGSQPVAGCSSWNSPEIIEVPLLMEASPSPEVPPTIEPQPVRSQKCTTASRRVVESTNLSKTLIEQGERTLLNRSIFSKELLALIKKLTDAIEESNLKSTETLKVVVKILEEVKKAKSNT